MADPEPDCPACNDTGSRICNVCQGRGYYPCEDCEGWGNEGGETCWSCDDGYEECSECDGDGWLSGYGYCMREPFDG